MSQRFTSVDRSKLQQAFARAWSLSQSEHTPEIQRRHFADIAKMIWQAHGERGPIPKDAANLMAEMFRAAERTMDPKEALRFEKERSEQ